MPLYRGTAKRALINPVRPPAPTIDAIGADLALWFDRNEAYKSSGGGIVAADSLLTVTRASTAYYFDSAGVMQLAAVNTLRLDYDPVTGVPLGILNEESRANLCLRSNEFNDAAWTQRSNLTITPGAIIGPDGLMSGTRVEATTSAATALGQSIASAGSATGNAQSVFAHKGSGATDCNRFNLRNDTTSTNVATATIDYDTGVLTVSLGSGVAKPLGNGWYRITLSATTGISAGDTLRLQVGFTSAAETAGEFAYLYGAQLEAGLFSTSYIPTAGSQVTRAADLISMATSGFPYNSLAGTIKLEARAYALPTPSVFTPMWNLRAAADASTKKIEQYLRHTTGNTRLFVRESSTNVVDSGDAYANTVLPGVSFKSAAAWEQDNFGFSVNGAPILPDTAGNIPAGLDTLYLGSGGPAGAGFAPVHIRRLEYYATRKPNVELPTLAAA